MFRRRVPLSFTGRVKRFSGRAKAFRGLQLFGAARIADAGVSLLLASGFACGVAVSFTPLVGFICCSPVVLLILYVAIWPQHCWARYLAIPGLFH